MLVVILGIYGGGAATAKWLNRHGAHVTVTDIRKRRVLARSLKKFTPKEMREIRFVLGGQHEEDFRSHDLIVLGPGVPRDSKYLAAAKEAKRPLANDASVFFRYVTSPVIAVTGTRGKTTTTSWIAQLLKKRHGKLVPTGNNPEHPFFSELDCKRKKGAPVVAELSSWQLEYLPLSGKSPHIALITNLHPDHLNRYRGMNDYANAKANIFLNQTKQDALLLNYDNPWHAYFAKKKHMGARYYVSKQELPKNLSGIFIRDKTAVLRKNRKESALFGIERFANERGEHNLENLLFAALAALLFDPRVKITEQEALLLPAPHMRQEIVWRKGNLVVVNDSCATSPDGTIAAINRFTKNGRVVLITGGTDKELEFGELASIIKKYIEPEHLVLLEGSATKKLLQVLQTTNYKPQAHSTFSTLKACVTKAIRLAGRQSGHATILFSPGAASFEKFLHEFDRGERFNTLIKRALNGRGRV